MSVSPATCPIVWKCHTSLMSVVQSMWRRRRVSMSIVWAVTVVLREALCVTWRFDKPLEIGQEIIFEDMIHYTTVKTNTFNGITHPAIGMLHADGRLEILRQYGYEDYRNRMD